MEELHSIETSKNTIEHSLVVSDIDFLPLIHIELEHELPHDLTVAIGSLHSSIQTTSFQVRFWILTC